ncbi:hypothetical protein [Streptomyces sp. NPDC006477]|uniref:hypothetical protein n=1 Tax=Streptomyces sp. NPDC006477 TaxID=3364747 RepID=UPI0036B2109A
MAPRPLRRRTSAAHAACAALIATQGQAQAAPATDPLTPATRFYMDPNSKGAEQALTDLGNGDFANAANTARLASRPQAEWFTECTPDESGAKVRSLVRSAYPV